MKKEKEKIENTMDDIQEIFKKIQYNIGVVKQIIEKQKKNSD